MKKYCTRCGHEFAAVGREVICPSCKQAAAEEAKKAAVLKAKRASWTGESVPVRISGRASTVIREYGKTHRLPFAAALDALLQSTPFFKNLGTAWEDIVPYKSRRLKKSGEQDAEQDAPQGKPQTAQEVKPQDGTQTSKAKKAVKTSKAKKAVKTAEKENVE